MIGALIQARMSSTRLPGKVLKQIDNRPMLSYMLERVRSAKTIDKIGVITSLDDADSVIFQLCQQLNVFCYRGSLNDVLDRYYQAAKKLKADTIVRLTGDCPLIDPAMIDEITSFYKKNKYDYVANTIPPKWTVPEGMDVEVFSFRNLERAWFEAQKPSEREHVTFYFWKNPQFFSIFRYDTEDDFSHIRLTVDYPEDFEVIKTVITNLYPKKPLFSMRDIIEFLKQNPYLCKLNNKITSNQGWQAAYEKDKKAGFNTE